jgi:spermidine synthase
VRARNGDDLVPPRIRRIKKLVLKMPTLALTADGAQAVRADGHAGVYALLAFAGVAAPLYQLAWQPALSDILGGDIESAAVLVAGFGLGVGTGCGLGGWLLVRSAIPLLRLMAVIELACSALGLASLLIFGAVGQNGSLPLVVALVLVTVSALPMGASLPLLVGDPARRGPVGAAVGRVLGLNFIGAGAGCLVGLMLAFVSPWVGAQAPFYVAVAVNAIVALGAMVAHRRGLCERAVAASVAPAVYRPRPPMLALGPLLWFAAAGGFVALAFEIFFLRIVSYATGSGAIAFAVTAGTFLAGLAVGARQAGANCKTLTRDGAMRRAVGVLMRGSVLALLFLPLIAHLGWLDRGVVAVAVLMIYLVARCWGALMPYLAELGIAPDGAAGRRVAILGVANSLGAAAGALGTSFVLIDGLGLVATAMVLVAAGLACAMTLVGALVMPRPEKILRVSLAAALGLLALVMAPRSSADVRERLQWVTASEAGMLAPRVDDGGR